MTYQETDNTIETLQKEVDVLREKILQLRQEREWELFEDYTLKDAEGQEVRLSELFKDKDELLLVHNMGKGCAYCTLWADGFSSLTQPLNDRVPFVLVSPNPPEVMKEFAESRHWAFKTISAHESTFTLDAGFAHVKEGKTYYMPGVSAFAKKDGKIYRTNKDYFGPGDYYCNVWPFFDLLPKGQNQWQPKFAYPTQ